MAQWLLRGQHARTARDHLQTLASCFFHTSYVNSPLQVHHTFMYTVSVAAEYAHPLEWLLGNALPFLVGPRLVNAHCAFVYTWMVLRIAATIEGHSGYSFSFSPFRVWPPSGGEHVSVNHSPLALQF